MANRHEDLTRLLRALQLHHTAAGVDELALRAAKEGLTHAAFLYELVQQEVALALLADSRIVPTFDAVRELVRRPEEPTLPALVQPPLDFQVYDALLEARCADG